MTSTLETLRALAGIGLEDIRAALDDPCPVATQYRADHGLDDIDPLGMFQHFDVSHEFRSMSPTWLRIYIKADSPVGDRAWDALKAVESRSSHQTTAPGARRGTTGGKRDADEALARYKEMR